MDSCKIKLKEITIRPEAIYLYVPPIVWKGDPLGHIGEKDLFFWVIEGECFLKIDNQNYIVHPGQLAYLPKGKMRTYTHVSERFTMYEMSFSAEADGTSLMELLGLTENDFVVNIPDKKEMSALFEGSYRKELVRNSIYDLTWCANITNVIKIYAHEHSRQSSGKSKVFRPVLEYMTLNLGRHIKIDELAAIMFMQPTYFIKKFSEAFGISPLSYFNRMKIYQAMSLLVGTELPIDEISGKVGFADPSYFTRMFKKHCRVTPTMYRNEFKQTIKQ